MRKLSLCAFGLILIIYSCNNPASRNNERPVEADQSINKTTSFNNLFIDSIVINTFLSKHPQYEKFRQQYNDFYKLRNYQCAWFDSNGMIEQAYNFMNLISNAVNIYNDSSLYNKQLADEVDVFKTDTSN